MQNVKINVRSVIDSLTKVKQSVVESTESAKDACKKAILENIEYTVDANDGYTTCGLVKKFSGKCAKHLAYIPSCVDAWLNKLSLHTDETIELGEQEASAISVLINMDTSAKDVELTAKLSVTAAATKTCC